MGKDTAISWTDHTFNPWWGCFKVSPGCKNCYAAAFDHRLGGDNWQLGGPRKTFGGNHWKQPLRWDKAAKADGVRRRVFCASMADVFEDREDLVEERIALWELILSTAHLDWLLLTKRPENFARLLPWGEWGMFSAPLRNVWLGVTAEDQEHADKRIPLLRAVDAAVRFVSYEPALGRIDWSAHLTGENRPDWVIFGDESGRKRRPAEIEWARETRDVCAASGVAFHFKQWCGDDAAGVSGARDGKGGTVIHLPVLDGQQHAAFPTKESP